MRAVNPADASMIPFALVVVEAESSGMAGVSPFGRENSVNSGNIEDRLSVKLVALSNFHISFLPKALHDDTNELNGDSSSALVGFCLTSGVVVVVAVVVAVVVVVCSCS